MRRKSFAEMSCPIARSLEILGEWWTLLIVRDALLGVSRFDEFKRTGIADNILSSRLDRLVHEEILDRVAYQAHPPRYEYLLTQKGKDLLPIVMAMGRWGLRWTNRRDLNAPRLFHAQCGTELAPNADSDLGFDLHCRTCERAVPARELELRRRTEPAPEAGTARAG